MRNIVITALPTLVLYSVSLAQGPPHELRDMGQTVLDTGTRLQWVKDPSVFNAMTWDNARDFVENLEFAGHSDWRLPSGLNPDGSLCNSQLSGANCRETELGHLYFFHYLDEQPPGEMSPFENFKGKQYWTATEFPDDPTKAMSQDFIDGGNNPWSKSASLSIWPVRNAQVRWFHHPILGWILLFFIIAAIASFAVVHLVRRSLQKS